LTRRNYLLHHRQQAVGTWEGCFDPESMRRLRAVPAGIIPRSSHTGNDPPIPFLFFFEEKIPAMKKGIPNIHLSVAVGKFWVTITRNIQKLKC